MRERFSSTDIMNVMVLTGIQSKGRKQLRIHLSNEITKAMETILITVCIYILVLLLMSKCSHCHKCL